MKKKDMKKLALLGITGGILMTQGALQAEQTEGLVTEQLLAGGSCGGMHGCHGQSSGGGGYYDGGYYSGSTQGCSSMGSGGYYSGSHSCSSMGSGGYYSGGQSCSSMGSGGYYSGGHSCSSMGSGGYYSGSQGCNSMGSGNYPRQQGYNGYQPQPPQTGEGNKPQTYPPMPQKMMPDNQSQPQSNSPTSYNNRRNSLTAQNDDDNSSSGTGTGTGKPNQTPGSDNPNSYRSYRSRTFTAQTNGEAKSGQSTQLTKDQLVDQLNDEGKDAFNKLSPEGQALALKLASSSCKGKNDCKGLNSCRTDKNSCAGMAGCAGQSKCAFKDKNLAVKVAAKKMADKRAMMNTK